jgi:hypothetical protein
VSKGKVHAEIGSNSELFDNLVGGHEQLVRHGEAEHPGGRGVDDQLGLGQLHDRQIGPLIPIDCTEYSIFTVTLPLSGRADEIFARSSDRCAHTDTDC